MHNDIDNVLFAHYLSPIIQSDELDPHTHFLVNTMPKSGTIWMASLLTHLLRGEIGRNITIVHVFDEISTLEKKTKYYKVATVRDMRDIVVSWFYETKRSDQQCGFEAPRYPSIEDFYWNFLLGYLNCSSRFAYGNFDLWLDDLSRQQIPIVRYEDMLIDTMSSLKRVLNFWKISIPEAQLSNAVNLCEFQKMKMGHTISDTVINRYISSGHLREGKQGGWQQTMTDCLSDDINNRFKNYQSRLRYI